jgi:CBS domain-containing protein
MFPEVKVHAPRGVLPKVAVRQRTVLHYQPSWLLLAVPAVLVLRSRRSKTRARAGSTAASSPGPSGGATAGGGRRRSASTARTIMTGGVECVREHETVLEAARKMDQLGVGSLPICGSDERLKGMLTDRDIVVKVLALGQDPSSTTAGQLAQGKPVTIGADDSVQELARTMAQHQVKRLPVIDGHRLVGVVSEADLAEHASPEQVVAVVRGVYDSSPHRRFGRRGSR